MIYASVIPFPSNPLGPDPASFPEPFVLMTTPSSPSPDPSSDEGVALMMRLKGGDDNALRELVLRWQTPLQRYFARQVKTFQEAEDLTQNVFLRLYRGAADFQPGPSFTGYLFCIARRVLYNHWRTQKRKPLHLVGDEVLRETVEAVGSPVLRHEEEEIFATILADLPEKQQAVLLLRVQQELDYAEIAEALEISLANVKVLLHRAREAVRLAYRNHEKN